MDWTNVATFIPFYFLNKATTPLPLKNVAYIVGNELKCVSKSICVRSSVLTSSLEIFTA